MELITGSVDMSERNGTSVKLFTNGSRIDRQVDKEPKYIMPNDPCACLALKIASAIVVVYARAVSVASLGVECV
jgi:hypothetical protein